MPFMAFPLGPSEMSTWGGSFFASVVYLASNPPTALPPPTWSTDFPSAVNVQVVPGGGFSGLPPTVAVSAAHSPTSDGGSFFASFVAGAASVTARARTAGIMAGGSGGAPLIPPPPAPVNPPGVTGRPRRPASQVQARGGVHVDDRGLRLLAERQRGRLAPL